MERKYRCPIRDKECPKVTQGCEVLDIVAFNTNIITRLKKNNHWQPEGFSGMVQTTLWRAGENGCPATDQLRTTLHRVVNNANLNGLTETTIATINASLPEPPPAAK